MGSVVNVCLVVLVSERGGRLDALGWGDSLREGQGRMGWGVLRQIVREDLLE